MMNGREQLLLILQMDSVAKFAVSAGLAKALAENTELEYKRTGGLSGVAAFCMAVSGGTVEVTQNREKIAIDRKKHSNNYMDYLLNAASQGPHELERACTRLENSRNIYYGRVAKIFAEANRKNNSTATWARGWFEVARAVKIASLGTLALLGAVGGAVGATSTVAFGYTIEGFGFAKGLVAVLGTKAAYTGTTSWFLKTDDIKAVAVETGGMATKETGTTLAKTAAERTVTLGLYSQVQKWSQTLLMGKTHQEKVSKANQDLMRAQKSQNPQRIAQAERKLARRTATVGKHSGRVTAAKVGTDLVKNGLPLLWLGLDLKGVWDEASKDAALLN